MQDLNVETARAGHLNPDFIQVRCPECFSGYNVSAADMKVAAPQFECSSCQTRFFISKAEALQSQSVIVGQIPANEVALDTPLNINIFSCPKCSAGYSSGESECKKCGVVFFKFKESAEILEQAHRDTFFPASKEVRELWEAVLNDYENIDTHQNFVSAAWVDKSLDYAALKYGTILEIVPQDQMALKLVKEIQELTKVNFEMEASESQSEGLAQIDKFSFYQSLGLSIRRIQWINLILVGCGFIITMGMFLPHLRNLIGFGSSILFFILALRYYFRVI